LNRTKTQHLFGLAERAGRRNPARVGIDAACMVRPTPSDAETLTESPGASLRVFPRPKMCRKVDLHLQDAPSSASRLALVSLLGFV
jgi:hypothetical protein